MPHWFKPKARGYGNVPTSWQGWAVTLGFAVFVVAMVWATYSDRLSKISTVGIVLAVTAVYISFIRYKTDGEWRWR